MDFIVYLKDFLQHNLMISNWRDIAEIAIISTIIYAFIRWISHDTQKNLVLWFYGYCAFILFSRTADLENLSYLIFITSPIALLLFIIIHQQTLQKNFITLTSLSPQAHSPAHWLEELIQGCLHALNKNQEIFCIIERTDSLEEFLSAHYFVNADMTQELLALLATTTPPHQSTLLWVTHAGKLLAFNPTWHALPNEIWINTDVKALHLWKQQALHMSEKSDGILFTFDPTTRLCTIIAEGALANNVSAHHAFTLLKNYCSLNIPTTKKSGDIHGHNLNQKNQFKQTFNEK